MAEWVIKEDSRARKAQNWNPADPRPEAFSIQCGFWQPLAAELAGEIEAVSAADVREKLQLCGLLMGTASTLE
jgi:hypothetical protein